MFSKSSCLPLIGLISEELLLAKIYKSFKLLESPIGTKVGFNWIYCAVFVMLECGEFNITKVCFA